MDRLYQARIAYRTAFDSEGPRPAGVADEDLAEALELAVHTRTPIESGRDWSADRGSRSTSDARLRDDVGAGASDNATTTSGATRGGR